MTPTHCDLDTSIPDWLIDHPETLHVFRSLGLDDSCAGKSLAYVCNQQGLDPRRVLEMLYAGLRNTKSGPTSPETTPILAAIQVGRPQTLGRPDALDPMDRPWTSAFVKHSCDHPVHLGLTNLEGDEQADLEHHGGPDKAVLAYSAQHYPAWHNELNNPSIPFGGFGENFTIDGFSESNLCIGDIWQVGDHVQVQISQPRQPCWKLARRWRIKKLALLVQQTGRTGWYYRVLQPGIVAPGMPLCLIARPHPDWTVDRANRTMHQDKTDLLAALNLAQLPELSASWKRTLSQRAHGIPTDPSQRLGGESP